MTEVAWTHTFCESASSSLWFELTPRMKHLWKISLVFEEALDASRKGPNWVLLVLAYQEKKKEPIREDRKWKEIWGLSGRFSYLQSPKTRLSQPGVHPVCLLPPNNCFLP